MSQTAIYALTPQGARLGRILADKLGGDLFLPARLAATHGAISFGRLLDVVADNFYLFPAHVFITATGIAVRAIAPHLVSKDRDPAV
ncbi:MAG: cobalamin biosynthesis protein CbiG, partial [Thermodesulfobacteriota bacterium]|nr:cobalamin biosynthesis protein CbiG [Thermodesulfobacteriota bacterium]